MNTFLQFFVRLFSLIHKEFIVMFMDKGTRKILILPIIIQSFLFGYGATFNLDNVPWILMQNSHDAVANKIVQQLQNNPTFQLVRYCTDERCFKQSLDHGDALFGLYIGSHFTKDHVLFAATDARNTASANTALSYVQDIITEINNDLSHQSKKFHLDIRYTFNENNITRHGILTGLILALSMIQVTLLASFSVAREREEGTFDMMLMTPLTPLEILIGKAFPPTIIAIVQALMLFLICLFWFEIPFYGNFFALLLVIAIFSLCCVGIGLAISALASTSQQAVVVSFSLILPNIMLSGLITPHSAMPVFVQYISYLDPFYYGLAALHRIYLEGQSFIEIVHLLFPLLGLGSITLFCALVLFRGRLD